VARLPHGRRRIPARRRIIAADTMTILRSKRNLVPALLAGTMLLSPLPLHAEPVEEIVITATRVPTPLDRLPGGITVVTRAEIDRHGWQTLPDALRLLPGVAVVSAGGPGAQTSVFMRGANSDHVLVLLDGLPLNDPSLAAGAFNFGDDLLGGVQRIEVVRGPASSLYGSNAIGGVVNLITPVGADAPARAGLDVGIGTDRTYRGTASLRGTLDRLDYALALEGFTTAGDDATPGRFTTNTTREEDGFDNLTGTAKAAWRLEGGRVEGLVRWRRADIDLDSVPTDDPNYQGRNETLSWQTAAEGYFLDEALTSRLTLGQTRFDRRFTNDADAGDASTGRDSYDGVRTRLDWLNSYALPGRPGTVVALGASAEREAVDFTTRSDGPFGPFDTQVDAEADSIALYATAQTRLADRLDLTAGLRHDRPDDYGNRTTWRLGAVLALPEVSSRLTGAVGTAFKAPTLYDRFGTNSFGYLGNPELEAEESLGWEAGVETDLPGGLATLSAVYFRNDVENLIAFQYNPDFTSTVVNIGEAVVEGVETTLTLRPAPWLEADLRWTWTDAQNADTSRRLLRRPEYAVSLDATLRPLPGLSITPEVQHVGRRLDSTYRDDGGFRGTAALPGYWQVNLAVAYDVGAETTLYARAVNLADRTIENPDGFAQPDRGVLAGLRARF